MKYNNTVSTDYFRFQTLCIEFEKLQNTMNYYDLKYDCLWYDVSAEIEDRLQEISILYSNKNFKGMQNNLKNLEISFAELRKHYSEFISRQKSSRKHRLVA